MGQRSFQRSACLALAAAAASGAAGAQELLVRIGHVGPTSGAQAEYGKDNENGARLAVEDLNAQGLSIGGRKARFELAAEDDAADPKQATAVAQKLCDAQVNGVVGHLNSGTTIPAARVYSDCGIPVITPSATNPQLTKSGYKATYRLLADDNALGAGLARHADHLKLKTVAVIDDRTAYGHGVAEVFKREARSLGIQVVAEAYTSDKATDFTAILTQIRAKRPQAVFFGGLDPQAGPMLRQMQQLGLGGVKFMGGDGFCTERLPELAGQVPAVANVVCATGGASLDAMPGGKAWKLRYDARFPGQFQVYSPYAYDAVMVLADAMRRAGSADPKAYAPALAGTRWQGVTAMLEFDAHGELKHPGMTLYRYQGGKKVVIGD